MELAYCCDLAIVLAVFVLLTSNVGIHISRKKYFAQKTSLFTQKALLVFCITLMLCLTSRGVENRNPKKSLVKLYFFRCFPLKHFFVMRREKMNSRFPHFLFRITFYNSANSRLGSFPMLTNIFVMTSRPV